MVWDQGPGVALGLSLLKDQGQAFKKRSTILFIPEDIPSLYSPGHNVLEKAGDVKSGLAGHGFYSLTEFTGITEKYMIVQRP